MTGSSPSGVSVLPSLIAWRAAGTKTAISTTTNVMMPATTSSVSTGITSASGPNTTIPIGIDTAITMPTNPNTRPWRSGSTRNCSRVIAGVEKNGTASPTRNMNPKNSYRFVDRPRATESNPNTTDDALIISTLFFVPPQIER